MITHDLVSAEDVTALFSKTLEHIQEATILFDGGNRILYLNHAAELISGWSRDEVIGQNLGVLAPAAIRERYDTFMYPGATNCVSGLSAKPRQIELVCKDGQSRWITYSISKVSLADKTAHLVFLRDATPQRQQQERERLLSLGFDETDSAVVITDCVGRIVQINKGFRQMLGFDDGDAIGRIAVPLLMRADYRPEHMQDYLDRLSAGECIYSDELIYTRSGKPLWCSVIANPIFNELGDLANMVGVLTDITLTKIHEVLQNKMLNAIVREVPTADIMQLLCEEVERIAPQVIASVLLVDEDGRLRTLAGPSLPEDYSAVIDGISIGPHTGSCGTAAWSGETVIACDIATDPNWDHIKHLALDRGLASCWSTPIKSSDDQVLGTFAFYYRQANKPDPFHQLLVDVSVDLCALVLEREQSRNRIRRLAFYDDLTGLPNRSLLQIQADQAIIAAGRTGTKVALLFIDLDRFKQINDSLGHPAGDQLLRIVAQRLQDVTAPRDIVGRLSGDEFVMVLMQIDSQRLGDRIEKVQRCLSEPTTLSDIVVRPSASIGISVFPHDGRDMETLLHRADMAMYQSKHNGYHGFRFYSHEMDLAAQERLALETALRNALEHDQLQLHYQPQINLKDQSLHSVEALARWRHPQLGDISPLRFIALAEECGLIGDIGQWALRSACRQLTRWRHDGLEIPSVSVNLSPTDFHNLDLPQLIRKTLQDEALSPSDLTLEITENVLIDNDPRILSMLEIVHDMGITLSMDDFGTGYSNLSYLRQLPVTELKLDRSFVGDMEHDEVARALTRTVQHIGESLHMKVVAEGVETERQLHLLRDQGYHIAQGYHFSPALPHERFAFWLRDYTHAIESTVR